MPFPKQIFVKVNDYGGMREIRASESKDALAERDAEIEIATYELKKESKLVNETKEKKKSAKPAEGGGDS